MNALFKAFDGALNTAAGGLKSFSMSFQRTAGWWWVPRTRRNYGQDIGQGLNSSIVLALVGWAQRNFPDAPLRVVELRKEGKVIKREPVLPADAGAGFLMTLWNRPNESYTGRTLSKALLADYMTVSNCYVAKVRNGSGRVVELWWLPAHLTEPEGDENEFITRYRYNPNGIPIYIKPEDIIHIRDGMDPKNPRKGLARLGALIREIYTDEEASNFSATVLTNMGVPGVIISPESTGIAANNRIADPEGVKAKYIETFGGDRRGDPMVLTAPTKVEVISWSPKDLTLTELRRIPEERASAVTGIPAIVVGFGAGLERSTYSNMGEAREGGVEEFLVPLWGDWAEELRYQLLAEFADPKRFEPEFDITEVRVLQEDQNKLVERNLKALLGGGITRRVFKENVGEDPDKDTDEVYYIPTNVVVTNAEETPPPTAEEQAAEDALNPPAAPPLVGDITARFPPIEAPGAGATNGNGRAPVATR